MPSFLKYRAAITGKERMKMNNQSMKIPFREAVTLNKRAFMICWKNSPGIIISTIVASIVTALFPYVNIYFSARIIGELAGGVTFLF